MRPIGRGGSGGFVFHLDAREKALLAEVVRRYPFVPAAHHRISRSAAPAKNDDRQVLLDEALAEHRRERREQVRAMLNAPSRLTACSSGYRLHLGPEQVEWLLQVLNDVRVGCWLALGEPEEMDRPRLTADTAPLWRLMEAAGRFETTMIEAIGGRPARDT